MGEENIVHSIVHAFAEFASEDTPLEGKKVRIGDIVGKEITVLKHKITKSKRNEGGLCLYMQFVLNEELCLLFSGSLVLQDLCDKYAGQMPFRTTVKQIDRFYTFS
jgi:hypothetical protein